MIHWVTLTAAAVITGAAVTVLMFGFPIPYLLAVLIAIAPAALPIEGDDRP